MQMVLTDVPRAEGAGVDETFAMHRVADMGPDEFEIAAEDQVAGLGFEADGADMEIGDRRARKTLRYGAGEQHQLLDGNAMRSADRIHIGAQQDAAGIGRDAGGGSAPVRPSPSRERRGRCWCRGSRSGRG